jgi:hypothetical protein
MFGILVSAFNVVLGFVFRSILVKFVVMFALYFVVTGFVSVLANSGLLPSASSLSSSLGGIPSTVWYFLDLFSVSFGLKLVVAAMAAKFIIRRIPFIG